MLLNGELSISLFSISMVGLLRPPLSERCILKELNGSLSSVAKSAERAAAIMLITVVFPDPLTPMKKLTSLWKLMEISLSPQKPEISARSSMFKVTSWFVWIVCLGMLR